jgi:hypothetical protein
VSVLSTVEHKVFAQSTGIRYYSHRRLFYEKVTRSNGRSGRSGSSGKSRRGRRDRSNLYTVLRAVGRTSERVLRRARS